MHEDTKNAYREPAHLYTRVARWAALLHLRGESLKDDPGARHGVQVATDEMCRKEENMVTENRRVTAIQVATELGICVRLVKTTVFEGVAVEEVTSRWVS